MLRNASVVTVAPSWPTVSVVATGADRSGTTDSTQAFLNAVDTAVALGVPQVFVPAGTYKVSAAIELKGCSLIGEAASISRVVADANATDSNWRTGIEKSGSLDVIRAVFWHRNQDDVMVKGIGVNASDIYASGFMLLGGSRLRLIDNYVTNSAKSAIQFYGEVTDEDEPITDAIMRGNITANSRWNLVVDGTAYNVVIDQNVSRTPTNRHISLDPGEATALRQRGFVVTNNVMVGWREPPAAWSSHVSNTNRHAAIGSLNGIVADVVIAHNIIRGWDKIGINLPQWRGIIEGNHLDGHAVGDFDSETDMAEGIVLDRSLDGTAVRNNTIRNATDGIVVEPPNGSDENIYDLTGNVFRDVDNDTVLPE